MAVRPARLPALVLGVALIVSGAALPLILLPTLPLALVEIALGALALRSWRKMAVMAGAAVLPPGCSGTS